MMTETEVVRYWEQILTTLRQRGLLKQEQYPVADALLLPDRAIFILDMQRLGGIPREEWLDRRLWAQWRAALQGRRVIVSDRGGLAIQVARDPGPPERRQLPAVIPLTPDRIPPEPYRVCLGLARHGPVVLDIAGTHRAILIGGTSGSGKTNLIQSILLQGEAGLVDSPGARDGCAPCNAGTGGPGPGRESGHRVTGGTGRSQAQESGNRAGYREVTVVGLLWFDDDPGKTLGQKVEKAVRRYTEKFGRQPTVCYVHPSMLNGHGPVPVAGVRLAPRRSVLRDHFLVMREEDETDGRRGELPRPAPDAGGSVLDPADPGKRMQSPVSTVERVPGDGLER